MLIFSKRLKRLRKMTHQFEIPSEPLGCVVLSLIGVIKITGVS